MSMETSESVNRKFVLRKTIGRPSQRRCGLGAYMFAHYTLACWVLYYSYSSLLFQKSSVVQYVLFVHTTNSVQLQIFVR